MGVPQPEQALVPREEPVRLRAGYTSVSSRALNRTVEAISADYFAVPRARVSVRVREDAGLLSITVSAPLPIPLPAEAARHPDLVREGGGTVYQRAETARAAIGDRVRRLTGSPVVRLDIRLTGTPRTEKKKLQ
ncbi:hypothetical protein GCM10023081_29340 [Arthrobacter ginkgonis]|uniref:Uncharacterized protein n=1 Tax=Arthrobacter ginkgonis TaxID=1630594 RepID=A0ABP7CKJ6_9MICC